MRSPLIGLLCLAACGRSELVEGEFPDASVVMPPPQMVTAPKPTQVFANAQCPEAATVDALKPGADERVFAVEFRAQEECSGAGGDWFIGRELAGPRQVAFGNHACWFMPQEFRSGMARRFGVVRVNLRAVTKQVPEGWCLESLEGNTARTDVNVLAFGVYASEADAKAAAQALR